MLLPSCTSPSFFDRRREVTSGDIATASTVCLKALPARPTMRLMQSHGPQRVPELFNTCAASLQTPYCTASVTRVAVLLLVQLLQRWRCSDTSRGATGSCVKVYASFRSADMVSVGYSHTTESRMRCCSQHAAAAGVHSLTACVRM